MVLPVVVLMLAHVYDAVPTLKNSGRLCQIRKCSQISELLDFVLEDLLEDNSV